MNRISKIADKLSADWFDRAPYQTLTGDLAPLSIEDAYQAQHAVQNLMSQQRGPVAGRKIALSSKAMQQMCGIDQPIAGAFFENDVHHSPAQIELENFLHMGLEFELALELQHDIAPQSHLHTSESAASVIASVRPAFELIEDKNADYNHLDVLTMIADNAWCGGVVLGQPIRNWKALDLGNLASCVYQDGKEPEETNTGAAEPLNSLAWILNHFSARHMVLKKGEHIITGSAVRTRFPVNGDTFTYAIGEDKVELQVN